MVEKRGFIEGFAKKKLWKKTALNDIVILQAAAPNRNRSAWRSRPFPPIFITPVSVPPRDIFISHVR
jgi:hypothetical protein